MCGGGPPAADRATRRHPRVSAESCFLSDLTRFTDSRRAGPDPAGEPPPHTKSNQCTEGAACNIHRSWRGARAAESARLESVCGATHRGFESHSLRQRTGSPREAGSLTVTGPPRRLAGMAAEIRYANNAGVFVAYQVFGDGERDSWSSWTASSRRHHGRRAASGALDATPRIVRTCDPISIGAASGSPTRSHRTRRRHSNSGSRTPWRSSTPPPRRTPLS